MEVMEVSRRDMSVKAKKLRQQGLVPGHVFGGHLEQSVLLQVDEKVLRQMLAHKRIGSRLTLSMEGKKLPVQIKDKDVDSQTGALLNISFQALAADQKVNSLATIVLKNTEKLAGMLEFMLSDVPYEAYPQDMIDTVEIDTDGMAIGTVVTVGDVKELCSDKIELKVEKDEIIFRISDPKRYAASQSDETETEEPAAE